MSRPYQADVLVAVKEMKRLLERLRKGEVTFGRYLQKLNLLGYPPGDGVGSHLAAIGLMTIERREG